MKLMFSLLLILSTLQSQAQDSLFTQYNKNSVITYTTEILLEYLLEDTSSHMLMSLGRFETKNIHGDDFSYVCVSFLTRDSFKIHTDVEVELIDLFGVFVSSFKGVLDFEIIDTKYGDKYSIRYYRIPDDLLLDDGRIARIYFNGEFDVFTLGIDQVDLVHKHKSLFKKQYLNKK